MLLRSRNLNLEYLNALCLQIANFQLGLAKIAAAVHQLDSAQVSERLEAIIL